jgi:hypothetical protein
VRTSLPATLEYVFVPFRDQAAPPGVHTKVASVADDFTSLDLDFGDIHDIVFLAHDLKRAEREIAGCRTKGCFVVVRTAKGSQPAILLDADFGR